MVNGRQVKRSASRQDFECGMLVAPFECSSGQRTCVFVVVDSKPKSQVVCRSMVERPSMASTIGDVITNLNSYCTEKSAKIKDSLAGRRESGSCRLDGESRLTGSSSVTTGSDLEHSPSSSSSTGVSNMRPASGSPLSPPTSMTATRPPTGERRADRSAPPLPPRGAKQPLHRVVTPVVNAVAGSITADEGAEHMAAARSLPQTVRAVSQPPPSPNAVAIRNRRYSEEYRDRSYGQHRHSSTFMFRQTATCRQQYDARRLSSCRSTYGRLHSRLCPDGGES